MSIGIGLSQGSLRSRTDSLADGVIGGRPLWVAGRVFGPTLECLAEFVCHDSASLPTS